MADEVIAAGMSDDVMVMSLRRSGLQAFASVQPKWPRGLLSTASIGDLTRLDVSFLALNTSAATHSMIRQAHSQGIQVYVWTVNDPIQMSVMISRGVDGIITDKPGLARQVLDLREDLSLFGRLMVWLAGESGFLHLDD